MSNSSSTFHNNDNSTAIAFADIAGSLNEIEKTEHQVLAVGCCGTTITLGDFIKAFRYFQETYKHDSSDNIDPIKLTEAVTKLIDVKYPGASVMDKLNVLVECGSTVKIKKGSDFWLGHLIDFCIGLSLLTRMGGDVTKNEGFSTIQEMWANFVRSLPGPE